MSTAPPERIRILCVDDEAQVLEGLTLSLRRRFALSTATSGAAALELLAREPAPAVIVSDMRMPGMNGAVFLAQARQLLPDTVRMLLTGQTDLDSAIAAVNHGQVFRFLTKPCPADQLLAAVDSAVEQHQLLTAERVLLEQTLHGSIKALTEVLALTNPVAFGRATRIKASVTELANALGLRERWQLEVAAMLSQLGFITLPPEVVDKLHDGKPLNEAEQQMVTRAPGVTEQLLGNIPRLEVVREILASLHKPSRRGPVGETPRAQLVERASQILRVAVDFVGLESTGQAAALALDTMRGRPDRYAPDVLTALSELRANDQAHVEIRELPLVALRIGMILADDVKMASGTLFLSRGSEVTAGFVERARNLRPGTVCEPVRVIIPATPNAPAAVQVLRR